MEKFNMEKFSNVNPDGLTLAEIRKEAFMHGIEEFKDLAHIMIGYSLVLDEKTRIYFDELIDNVAGYYSYDLYE